MSEEIPQEFIKLCIKELAAKYEDYLFNHERIEAIMIYREPLRDASEIREEVWARFVENICDLVKFCKLLD